MSRDMIAYDMPAGRFNLRAAAVVLREAHVLVGRTTTESIWYLPGGRVEWGESTRDAAERELFEELGVAGQVGNLATVMENFFSYGGKRFHEIAYYYLAKLPESFPFRRDGEVCHRGQDGDAELEFRWLPVDPAVLRANAFRPVALGDELAMLGEAFQHRVFKEQSWATVDV